MENKKNNSVFLWVGLFLGIVSSLIYYMFKLRENKKDLSTAFVNKYINVSEDKVLAPVDTKTKIKKTSEIPQKDNLKEIKGIGPAIEKLLNENKIYSFQDLSQCKIETLSKILEKKNLRLANPESWPEQAKKLLTH